MDVDREYRRVVGALYALADIRHDGQTVDQLMHALQVASRLRRVGADDELVMAGFVHDIGKVWHEEQHGAVAAALMHGRLRPSLVTLLAEHGEMRGGRRQPATAEERTFLAADAASTDDRLYPCDSFDSFLPALARVMGASGGAVPVGASAGMLAGLLANAASREWATTAAAPPAPNPEYDSGYMAGINTGEVMALALVLTALEGGSVTARIEEARAKAAEDAALPIRLHWQVA